MLWAWLEDHMGGHPEKNSARPSEKWENGKILLRARTGRKPTGYGVGWMAC